DTSHLGSVNRSTVVAGLLGGEVYVAQTVDPGKIVGCAVWFGPGRGPAYIYDRYVHENTLEPLMASFDKELWDWWLNTMHNLISPLPEFQFLPKYNAFVTSTLGEGTKVAAWNLQTLGVDPTYHRQGVAKLLVNTIVEK
ncbi:hypothetical protein K438DRAFT_1498424, partial [Mycena galopus ATCC 62051]